MTARVVTMLAVPLRETREHLAGPALADAPGRLDDGTHLEFVLTVRGVTLRLLPHAGRPGRSLAVDLFELAQVMAASVEAENTPRVAVPEITQRR